MPDVKGLPYPNASAIPDGPGAFLALNTVLMQGRTFRRFATTTAMDGVTDAVTHELAIVDAVSGAWFKYDGAAWVMYGGPLPTSQRAHVAAMNSAIAEAKVPWDTSLVAINSPTFSAGTWTITQAGLYRLSAQINFPSNGSALGLTVSWKKNGTIIRRSGSATSTVNETTVDATILVSLAAGDTVDCWVASGGTLALVVGATTVIGSVEYVRPS